jgi:hypothetical protein
MPDRPVTGGLPHRSPLTAIDTPAQERQGG